eukprot:1137257-Pelagomonas_calceolata.AAC.1
MGACLPTIRVYAAYNHGCMPAHNSGCMLAHPQTSASEKQAATDPASRDGEGEPCAATQGSAGPGTPQVPLVAKADAKTSPSAG